MEEKHKKLLDEETIYEVGGIFDYQFAVGEEEHVSLWRMGFMSKIRLWVMCIPPDHLAWKLPR